MTYIEQARVALLKALTELAPNEEVTLNLLDFYTLLVLTRGEKCTCEDVHEAWAVARQRTRPEHPDLVPFDALTAEVRAYDVPFRDAIREAARSLRLVPASPDRGGEK